MDKKPKEKDKLISIISIANHLVMLLVVPIILLSLLGLWLDKTFHTLPLFLILSVILGFTSSIYNIFLLIKTLDKK